MRPFRKRYPAGMGKHERPGSPLASCDFCGDIGHLSSTCKKRCRFEKAAAAQQQQARVAEPAETSEVRVISF